MVSTLPRPWAMITESWSLFVKTWDTTVQYSAWIILATVLQELPMFFPNAPGVTKAALLIIGPVTGIILALWTSVRLYLVIMALESGAKVTEKTTLAAMALIPSLLWIAVLQSALTLGGLILLVIPGIYVGIRLGFSQFSLLTKQLRGREALRHSWDLTKDRFWPVFGRQLSAGILFSLFLILATSIALMIVGMVAGVGQFEKLFNSDNESIGTAISSIVSSIAQAAVIPALMIFEVKLYRALEKTK